MRIRQIIFGAALASLGFGCVSQSDYDKVVEERNRMSRQLDEFGNLNEESSRAIETLNQDKTRLQGENSTLRQSYAGAQERINELQKQIDDLGRNSIPGVSTRIEDGAFIYDVQGDVLFDSGKHTLKPSAAKTLKELAELLKQNDYRIEIAGHTDSDPVSVTKKLYPHGNIELGMQRAITVWDTLKKEGVPDTRMHAASYGEFRPMDPSDKSRNRRVEIRVLVNEPTKSGG